VEVIGLFCSVVTILNKTNDADVAAGSGGVIAQGSVLFCLVVTILNKTNDVDSRPAGWQQRRRELGDDDRGDQPHIS
jgi:hypothetical protein